MKKTLLILFMVCSIISVQAEEFNTKYGKPLIALVITDPWLMIIGSDVPTFALYEHGQIIFKKKKDDTWRYFEIQYNPQEITKIIESFNISKDVVALEDEITVSYSTDQPENILLVNLDTTKIINVYGDMQSKVDRKNTPSSFLHLFDEILKFDSDSATEWIPDTFEVMALDYSHSSKEPLEWNKNWNDIDSQTTIKRNDDFYSIYLDKEKFSDFINLRNKLEDKQAVMINGKKFSIYYRFPFPNI